MPTPLPRPAPSLTSGQRGTADQPTSRLKLDVKDEIVFWEPEATTFQYLTRGIKERDIAKSYIKEWLESEPYPIEATVSGAQTIGDTAIELQAGQGTRFYAGCLLMNRRTRETILVSSVATDTLTVVRALGDTVSSTMIDGDTLEFVATAFEEGSDVATIRSVQEGRNFNLTEIFKTSFGYTGTDGAVSLYGGKDPENEAKKAGLEHKRQIERAMFFGKRFTRTGTGGKPQRAMGGLEYYIQSNVFDFSGAPLTTRSVTEALEVAMKYGAGGYEQNGKVYKWLFCSRRWATELELLWHDKIQIRTADELMGLKVREYQSTHGSISIVPVNIFNGEHSGFAFCVDMNHVAYCPLEGRDTTLYKNRQSPGIDGETDEFITEATLRVEVEAAHSLWKLAA